MLFSTMTATTSNSADSMSLQHKSVLINKYALELGSAFSYSAAIRTTLIVLAERFFRLNHTILTYLIFGGTIATLQTFLITKELTMRSTAALARVAEKAWNSRQARKLQKKVEFEFFVLILGCGNSFCLVIFWPGWILIGLAYLLWWVISRCAG